MKRIRLKMQRRDYIESRKYDWSELNELIGKRELIEIECQSSEEARAASITLHHTGAARDGIFTVRQSGSTITVDATGGARDA